MQGVVSEPVAPLADRYGAQHDPFHHRGEDVVAGVDGVLDVAQLKGETDPTVLGVSLLGAEQFGDADRWSSFAEDRLRDLIFPRTGSIT